MRDIKFRFWDLLHGEWASYSLIEFKSGGIPFHLYDFDIVCQQYTGLTDKDEKEIYEGDIVKLYKNHEAWIIGQCLEHSLPDYDSWVVKMLYGSWQICQKNIGASIMYDYACCEEHHCALEIVGNIYENPELIK